MTIIRTSHNRENPYVVLNKAVVQNGQLSLKARGFWALLMSYPNDWKFYVKNLIKECKEGRASIYNAIDELIAARLMVRIQTYERKNGKMCGGGVEYIIFEFPITEQEVEEYMKSSKTSKKCPHKHSGREADFWNPSYGDSGNRPLLSNDKIPINEETTNVVVVKGDQPPSFSVENVHKSQEIPLIDEKAVTKDDVYHYALSALKDWQPPEIEVAWQAYNKAKYPITDVYKYIEGVINNKRTIKESTETKCKQPNPKKQPKKKEESPSTNSKPLEDDTWAQTLRKLGLDKPPQS